MPALLAPRPTAAPRVGKLAAKLAAGRDEQTLKPRWRKPTETGFAPLDAAVVVFNRRDLWQARACVASVRHWAPRLPIELLADRAAGPVNLTPFRTHYGATPFAASRRKFGSPLSKLDVLFARDRRRLLVLDADTALLGPVRPLLERYDADFVVSPNHVPAANAAGAYFDPAAVDRAFPGYEYPGWVFNTGQMVVTSGVLTPDDFRGLVDWPADGRGRPACLRKDLMPLNDQPRLNVALHRLHAAGRISVDGVRFKRNPAPARGNTHDLPPVADLAAKAKSCPPSVLHWMGQKGATADDLTCGEIFEFYERMFFETCGRAWERDVRAAGRRCVKAFSSVLPRSARKAARRAVAGR